MTVSTSKTADRTPRRAEADLLDPDEIETLFQRLKTESPASAKRKTVKDDRDAFRALVACLLSAQSLDRNTAKAKEALFAMADTPAGVLVLPDEAVAQAIKPAGLYNMKTRNLKRLCRALIEKHGGVAPRDRAGLMSLPGIGRKCADIMLSFAFGEAVLAVDTHIHRVANRTGLACGRTEAETAASLEARAAAWACREGHIWLLDHGRRVCRARRPRCPACVLRDLCRFPDKTDV
jgi:endonuclease-3